MVRGLIATVVVGGVLILMLRANQGLPFVSYTRISVEAGEIGSLASGSPVEIAGVRVGVVASTEPTGKGETRLELRLDPSTQPLPEDTRAVVRARGLLGARSLELVPGDSEETLEGGETIRSAGVTNGVPEALRTFEPQTREALGTALGELGTGVAGRGQGLNEALERGAEVVADLELLSDAVLAKGDSVSSLLPSTEAATRALNAAGGDIAEGLGPGGESLQPFIDERRPLREAIAVAPATLESAARGLAEGRELVVAARDLTLALNQTLPPAPAGLDAAAQLLRHGRQPLRRAAPLVKEARRTVPSILGVIRRLDPALDPLRRTLEDLTPIAARLQTHRCDIDNFAENWRSMLGYGIPGGGRIGPLNSIRIEAIGSAESFGGLGPGAAGIIDRFRKRVPYPEPCRFSPGPHYDLDRVLGGGG